MSLNAAAIVALALAPASAWAQGPGAPGPGAPPGPAPAGPGPGRVDGPDALLHAYQREYAVVAAEEAALARRLDEVASDRAARTAAAASDLAARQERLRGLQRELEAERARLAALEQERATLDDGTDALVAVLSQADAVLPGGLPEDGAAPDAARRLGAADAALTRTLALIEERGRVRREPGAFFLQDGTETRGDLLRVGAIACLGASPRAAGTLAPAGGGALQLWSADGAAAARAAAGGASPRLLPLYVHDAGEQAVAPPRDETFAALVRRGGDVAYVIVALGAAAVLFVLVRIAILAAASGRADRLLGDVAASLARGEEAEALELARRARGAAARVVAAMLPHDQADRLESAASERMLEETLRLERFDTALTVSAAIAPLLGLLGTVTGMISTFDVITVHGTGDPRLLAGGISEALITTELGLVVAIPALLAANLLAAWAERIRTGMERAALGVALLVGPSGPTWTDAGAEATGALEPVARGGEPVESPQPAAPRRRLTSGRHGHGEPVAASEGAS